MEHFDEIEEQLRAALQDGRAVHVERSSGSDLFSNGFVLDLSPKLLLLHQFLDFISYGFKVLPAHQIASVRSNEYERFFEQVIAESGAERRQVSPGFPIGDWPAMFSELDRSEELLGIDLKCSNSDEDYVVGIISEASDDCVWILPATALGTWENEEVKLKYSDILAVEFGSPYIETLSKYLYPE